MHGAAGVGPAGLFWDGAGGADRGAGQLCNSDFGLRRSFVAWTGTGDWPELSLLLLDGILSFDLFCFGSRPWFAVAAILHLHLYLQAHDFEQSTLQNMKGKLAQFFYCNVMNYQNEKETRKHDCQKYLSFSLSIPAITFSLTYDEPAPPPE